MNDKEKNELLKRCFAKKSFLYMETKNGFEHATSILYHRLMAELSDKRIFNERFLTVSENLEFKILFEKVAKAFNAKAPSILVKPWLAGLAWRIEGLLAFCFGRRQNITRETARSSMSTTSYSNQKIKEQLGFEFISIDDSVKNAVKFFNENSTTK